MRTGFAGLASSSGGPSVPGAIHDLLVSFANQSADFSWTAPVSNGGSTIINHEFQSALLNILDTTFTTNTGTGFNFTVQSLAIQSDGKIVIGGSFTTFNGVTVNRIVRLNSDGTHDTAFTTNTGTGFNGFVFSIAVQSDGKIIVGGDFTAFNGTAANRFVRLNADGTRDTAFTTNAGIGPNGSVDAIVIQPDGKIIFTGTFTFFSGAAAVYIVRLNADGTRDTAFIANTGDGFNEPVKSLAIQSNGKIVCGGFFTAFNGTTANRIARLNDDGTHDTAFTTNTGTGFNSTVQSLAIQSDGNIIAGGDFTAFNGTTANRVARLSIDGAHDTAFTAITGTGANSTVRVIAVQSDGKIIVGGEFTAFNGTVTRVVRLNANSTFDATFTASTQLGFNSGVNSIAIQSDGKIIWGGGFPNFNGVAVNGIARLNAENDWSSAVSSGSSGTSYTFTGLTNGTSYMFRARAVNAIGAGPWVSTAIPVTPLG